MPKIKGAGGFSGVVSALGLFVTGEFENVTIFVFGLGFNLGNLPDFSDVDGTPAATPAAAPTP